MLADSFIHIHIKCLDRFILFYFGMEMWSVLMASINKLILYCALCFSMKINHFVPQFSEYNLFSFMLFLNIIFLLLLFLLEMCPTLCTMQCVYGKKILIGLHFPCTNRFMISFGGEI